MKYTSIPEPAAAGTKFGRFHPNLKFWKSIARSLKNKYEELTSQKFKSKKVNSKSKEHIQLLPKMQRGRPLMLGLLAENVKNFLINLWRKRRVINPVVAINTTRTLIEKKQDEHLKSISLNSSISTWILLTGANIYFEEWFCKKNVYCSDARNSWSNSEGR